MNNLLPSIDVSSQSSLASQPPINPPSFSLPSLEDSVDGFQTISKKRKKRGHKPNNTSQPAASLPAPNINSVHNPLPNTTPSSHPSTGNPSAPSALAPPAWPKLLVKNFKEITDDFVLEVIPAAPPPSLSSMPSMELNPASLSLSDNDDLLTLKRRGRPLGSKNKNSASKKQGSSASVGVSPMEELACADASTLKLVSS
ncbi:hypothetical protein SUGI_0729530 [Cryptomeria japonica]|nr:hypothetical protein SUGI_0729530 [Cryptomeria japonica]